MKRLIVCMAIGALAACFALMGCASTSGSSSASASDSASSSEAASSSAAESSASAESSSAAEPSDSSEAAEGSSSQPAQIVGGWTVPEGNGANDLTDEEMDIFKKAIGAQAGLDYEPIAVLATQVVSGQNIAYLCKGTYETENPTTDWVIVVVYNDLQGDASVTGVATIDLANVETTEDTADGEAVGAWEIQEAASGVAMTDEAAQAFSKAASNYDGVEINPLALLGTQVVSGTNYLILGTGHAVVQSPFSSLYVATVYEDLQGNCEFTDVSQFDLLAYVG